MTDESREVEGADPWGPLPEYLREPLVDAIAPPASREVDVLPFNQRSPEDFERICLLIAERVDGLRDPRLYGRRGQKQHGIDIVAWDIDDKAVVYQSRRWLKFTAKHLRKTVEDFANGRRPLDPKRFVVCVSAAASTDLVETLAQLREENDFEINLYDEERLSQLLKNRPDLVRRFFGDHWVAAFCREQGVTPVQPAPATILADALLRGPVAALHLSESVRRAEKALEAGDAVSARVLYGEVANRLEERGLMAQAAAYRRLEAQAAAAAGDKSHAAATLAHLAWETADAPNSTATRTSIRLIESVREAEDRAAELSVTALNEAQEWFGDPWTDLAELGTTLADLMGISPELATPGLVWFAESAVASGDLYLLLNHEAVLRETIVRAEERSRSDPVAVRLRLCLAEATGDWAALANDALHGHLERPNAALVHARYARFLAWSGQPDDALNRYRLAIDQACQAELEGEAAKALRSIFMLGTLYGLEDRSWWEAPSLTAHLRVEQQYISRPYDFRTYGLEALREDKLPTALRHFRAYLRDCVITGDLNGELAAHELLADVYRRSGEIELAVRHLAHAGKHKLAQEWMRTTEAYLDLTDLLDAAAPWVAASALSALAAEGPLIPDDALAELLARTIAHATAPRRQGAFTPFVWLSARELIAAIASRTPENRVQELLALFEPAIERQEQHHRHDDDQHVQTLLELFRTHAPLRTDIARHLMRLFAASHDLARSIIRLGPDVFELGRELFVADLRAFADEGSDDALDALLVLGEEHPRLIEEARRQLGPALAQSGPRPGVRTIGSTLPRTAFFIRLLPTEDRDRFIFKAIEQAEDKSDVEINRTDALGAVIVLAPYLSRETRRVLFERVLALGLTDIADESDDWLDGASHPLSAFRFDIGVGSLRPRAVLAAATLADEPAEQQEATRAALALLNSQDDQIVREAARALATLADRGVPLDPLMFANSPVVALRELAAFLWSRSDEPDEDTGKLLAHDPSTRVRIALATSLDHLGEASAVADSLRERLREDPSAAVRQRVARSGTAGSEDQGKA